MLNRVHGTRYTVAELERALAEANSDHISDEGLIHRLSSVQLTEMLSSSALARLEEEYPDPTIRPALIAVADVSALLAPPPSDIPMTPVPDPTVQASLLSRAMDFVHKSASRMSSLTATRETMRFEDTPAAEKTSYQPLQRVGNSSVRVVFRDGHENVEDTKRYKTKNKDSDISVPEFGFMLSTVVADAAKGEIDWDHWEHAARGDEAVVSYEVSEELSHFLHFASPAIVTGTTPSSVTTQSIGHDPGYHGEIWVNPVDGAILRLSVIAELKTPGPVTHADYLVEYGPVKIDGVSYIFPVKGVMIELRADIGAIQNGSGNEHEPSRLDTVQREYLYNVTYEKYLPIKNAVEH